MDDPTARAKAVDALLAKLWRQGDIPEMDCPRCDHSVIDWHGEPYEWPAGVPLPHGCHCPGCTCPITAAEFGAIFGEGVAAGVAEGRRQAAEDLTTWFDRLADRLPQYNPELPVCARRTNAAVLGAYERAAAIARDPRDNTRCSNCGDTRGGAPEHETSECVWDRHRMDDLLDVPREEPAAEPVGKHSQPGEVI